ncbi:MULTISPECIES: hypothetical protein [Lysinibacillus]|uniref:Uncharacterized protein n=1 Tax=Lysinibacillus capsici TaxID=2115968 RepID=A0ABY8KKD0_9BACI|nr:hypothetical protein [Lysinibacillus capsici]WGF39958.1 hypothetical protein QBO96_06735 [Lysinibacillus capsici]
MIETAQKMAQAETSNNAYQIQNLINKHLMSSYNVLVVTVAQIDEVTTASLLI